MYYHKYGIFHKAINNLIKLSKVRILIIFHMKEYLSLNWKGYEQSVSLLIRLGLNLRSD